MLRVASMAVLVVLGAAVGGGQTPAAGDKADALSDAARRGDAAAVKTLLDSGVDVNTRFRYDRTALSYACDRGHLDVVKLLLERGADVNVEDAFYHATALNWAVNPAMGRKPEHAEIVGLLLKRGAKGRENALSAAVSARDAAMVKVILDAGGIDPDRLSDALELAQKAKGEALIPLLEKAGGKPRVEFKVDEATLASYAGTYRNDAGGEIVLSVEDGHLLGIAGPQRLAFVARDAKTFGIVGTPGATITFTINAGKATSFAAAGPGPNPVTFTRVETK
jgi:hypothetical protein